MTMPTAGSRLLEFAQESGQYREFFGFMISAVLIGIARMSKKCSMITIFRPID